MAIRENLYPRKFIPYTHVYEVYLYTYTLTLAAMALYRYFSPLDSASLPSPKGSVSTTLSPAAIKETNDANNTSCGRGIAAAYSQNLKFHSGIILKNLRKIVLVKISRYTVIIYNLINLSICKRCKESAGWLMAAGE